MTADRRSLSYTEYESKRVSRVDVVDRFESISEAGFDFGAAASHPMVIVDHGVPPANVERLLDVVGFSPAQLRAEGRVLTVLPNKDLNAVAASVLEPIKRTEVSCVIGIGGGALTDIAGWVAANRRRGIALVLFPTTLVGMVDAAIGGKNAVDFVGVKNHLATLHVPIATICCTELLQPGILDGLSEAVKIGMSHDAALFQLIEGHARAVRGGDREALTEIIWQTARVVAHIVETVECKQDGLLYGHNAGNAFEHLPSGDLTHGDAIARGVRFEATLATRLGQLDVAAGERQNEVLAALGLVTTSPDVTVDVLLERMTQYRLGNRFIVPANVGVRGDDIVLNLPHHRALLGEVLEASKVAR